ncbi:MAG TPA: SMC-Scp complex subunit ScpB [Fimbriimonadaceae bacterium]|nr:SMC-Scp complex subunit ScpB [Fimbriimonadaceae bacterium]HRJ96454.1 SMC-Scp complex subunit ScpB [Fimbriimonadaceae bacterium]
MNLIRQLEAVLFVADTPVPLSALAESVSASEEEVREALQKLGASLQTGSALQLVRIAGGYQMCTQPIYADVVATFLKPAKQRLSRSLMEVLAIVAYRQPVTMAEIEAVRGVQSDYSVRQLADRRLIKEVGRRHTPGRPLLFGTTQQFLHQFNLEDLSQLPKLETSQPPLPHMEEEAAGEE